jgi:hypothetical protein
MLIVYPNQAVGSGQWAVGSGQWAAARVTILIFVGGMASASPLQIQQYMDEATFCDLKYIYIYIYIFFNYY